MPGAFHRMPLQDLSDETGATQRQIRSFIQEGKIPKALGNDVRGNYTGTHVQAIRKVLRIREEQARLRRISKNSRIVDVSFNINDEGEDTQSGE